MNTKSQDIIEIEKQISDSQPAIDKYAALQRLRNNADFQSLIETHYLKEEAYRLVHLKATPAMSSPEDQAKIIRDLDAIGTLYMFFITVSQEGQRSQNSKENAEQVLVELFDEQAKGE